MAKSHRDFVVYVKNGVEINALVAISHEVTKVATQTETATTVEHLTLVSLDPGAASQRPSGDQLRNSIKLDFDVPPLTEGKAYGWKDVESAVVKQVEPEYDGSGTLRYGGGDWTAMGQDASGFPVEKGSATDVTTDTVGPDGLTDTSRGFPWGSKEHLESISGGHSIHPDFVQTDPAAYKAFKDGVDGNGDDATGYHETLRENADGSSGHSAMDHFPSGDGLTPSGHGPNPAVPGTDPAQLDNPAPSSPKDEAIEQGDVTGQ